VATLQDDQSDTPASRAVDDQLSLVFACCHPALAIDARVALTLRSVGGLTTSEIAKAFLVGERTMVQRLFRARTKIRDAAIPFRVPSPDQLPERVEGVLAVLYLIFNEGYHATSGSDVVRTDLAEEAIWLTTQLHGLLPGEPEIGALLSLMELHDARRATRADVNGDIIPLDEQDRAQWDHARIRRAVTRIDESAGGRYRVEAMIAALHATAPSVDNTDWDEITRLYDDLLLVAPTAIVALNRAVAIGMAHGPDAGLRALAELDGHALAEYPWLAAARADMQRRLGRVPEATHSYRQALEVATNEADRRFLSRRLRELSEPTAREAEKQRRG
jgi:RNA polymerase sigma-70 factor, ECF subfamily